MIHYDMEHWFILALLLVIALAPSLVMLGLGLRWYVVRRGRASVGAALIGDRR